MRQQESYWTYRVSEPTPDFDDVYPRYYGGTREGWYQLSPGMRREIYRDAKCRETISKES